MSHARILSFTALQRCRTTVEDFVLTYFPLHGVDPIKGLLRHLDLLLFVEAAIYELDEENEALTRAGQDAAPDSLSAASALECVLQAEGAWNAAIQRELQQGYVYWQLERAICRTMASSPVLPGASERQAADVAAPAAAREAAGAEAARIGVRDGHEERPRTTPRQQGVLRQLRALEGVFAQDRRSPAAQRPPSPPPPSSSRQRAGLQPTPPGSDAQQPGAASRPAAGPLLLSDVLAAHEAKSFDYRVLHLLLHHLLGKAPDAALLEFCRVDELLVDIGDDLTDYEDDVAANSFNVYRGYLHVFGPQEAQAQLAQRIGQLEQQRQSLLQRLSPQQKLHVAKRQKTASQGQGADKWIIPSPILDEAAFRSGCASSGSSSSRS